MGIHPLPTPYPWGSVPYPRHTHTHGDPSPTHGRPGDYATREMNSPLQLSSRLGRFIEDIFQTDLVVQIEQTVWRVGDAYVGSLIIIFELDVFDLDRSKAVRLKRSTVTAVCTASNNDFDEDADAVVQTATYAGTSAGFWLRGSMPPCRLRWITFWKFDYEMVHSEVYLNKYVVSTAPFSTPACPDCSQK